MANSKMLPPSYFFLTIALMACLHLLLPVARVINYPFTLIGIIPLFVGTLLNLLADKALKDYKTTVKPFMESTTLITTGVYRLCRHPMYLGMALILLGLASFLGSLSPFVAIAVFVILMEQNFLRVEEQMLEMKFGQQWLEYKQRVRRWI